MIRVLKWGVRIAAAVLGLLLLCIVFAVLFLSPDHLRPQLQQMLAQQCACAVTLDNGVQWRWGRLIELQVPRLTVANPEGFDTAQPLLIVSGLRLPLHFWPLLHHRLHLERVEIAQLRLRLQRDAAGRDNWSALLAQLTAPGDGRYQFVLLRGVTIEQAEFSYVDPMKLLQLSNARVQLGALSQSPDAQQDAALATALHLGGQILAKSPAQSWGWQAVVDLNAELVLSPPSLALRGSTLAVDSLRRSNEPAERARQFRASLDSLSWDRTQQRVQMRALTVGSAGATLRADLQAMVADVAQITATLTLDMPHLRELAAHWHWALPATRDPQVLQSLQAACVLQFMSTPDQGAAVQLEVTDLVLDDTRIKGRLGWRRKTNEVSAQLAADTLNLDRYLPVESRQSVSQPVPLQWLHDLNARGVLSIDEARWQGLRAHNMRLELAP